MNTSEIQAFFNDKLQQNRKLTLAKQYFYCLWSKLTSNVYLPFLTRIFQLLMLMLTSIFTWNCVWRMINIFQCLRSWKPDDIWAFQANTEKRNEIKYCTAFLTAILQISTSDRSLSSWWGRGGPCRRRRLPGRADGTGSVWVWPTTRGRTTVDILTAPIRATPEPTLMIVGTTLNIPAWKTTAKGSQCCLAPPAYFVGIDSTFPCTMTLKRIP